MGKENFKAKDTNPAVAAIDCPRAADIRCETISERLADMKLAAGAAILKADTPEKIIPLLCQLEAVKRVAGELLELARSHTIDYINEHGPFQTQTTRFYVGTDHKPKCKDAGETLHRLFREFGGDMDQVAQCLASDAWKHGAIKSLVPKDTFDELFAANDTDKIKKGKPVQTLKTIPLDRLEVRDDEQ